MDFTYHESTDYIDFNAGNIDFSSELDEWFLVSGDTDDFIFYGENYRTHSEK